MFDNIKTISRIKKAALSSDKAETDENGKYVLRMTVRDDENFLSPYSGDRQGVISAEVADFLDNAAESLDLKKPILIKVSGDTIDNEEQKLYRAAVKKYYGNRIAETDARLKKNLILSVIMAIIGAAILSVCVLLHINDGVAVISELIDIAAWVFVWEAVDLFFLARPALRREQLHNCRLYDAEITYEK